MIYLDAALENKWMYPNGNYNQYSQGGTEIQPKPPTYKTDANGGQGATAPCGGQSGTPCPDEGGNAAEVAGDWADVAGSLAGIAATIAGIVDPSRLPQNTTYNTSAQKQDNTLIYAGMGFLALLMVGVILLLVKKS